jgi:pyruvate formate lyase activating enzyme
VWLEITNLVVPSWTDDLDMIKKMCEWLAENGFQDAPLHFSRFHPDHKLANLAPTPVETLYQARNIANQSGLNYVFIGNVPGKEGQDSHCPDCKKVVIERNGYTIINNNLNEGKCKYCGTGIAGVWN